MAGEPEENISADFAFEMSSVNIAGSQMRFIDTGLPRSSSAPTVLYLHGNSESSYVWRNIIPSTTRFRCVAPDLIGMGESDKPQYLSYRFTDHYTFIAAFIKAVIPTGPIVLVAHDWGTGLALHWAHQHPHRVTGIVLMEFVTTFPKWGDFSDEKTRKHWRKFRDPIKGRELIINQNLIMGDMIAGGAKRGLTEAELLQYRKPFLEPSSREVIWKWTTQIPIEDDPTDVFDIVTRYQKWLIDSEVPKLIFWYEDSPLVSGEKVRWYLSKMSNASNVDLGEAGHFVQEDHPKRIAEELQAWLDIKVHFE